MPVISPTVHREDIILCLPDGSSVLFGQRLGFRMDLSHQHHAEGTGNLFHAYCRERALASGRIFLPRFLVYGVDQRFGDVPWIDKVLNPDTDEPYGPRTPRDEVANNILTRLKWAEEHIGNFEEQDGRNAINQACVQMALSRFTLREGTWRKYHGLNDADKYLTECVRVSKD